jgi:hypothetical protein
MAYIYDVSWLLETVIIQEVEEIGNHAADIKYDVSESCIRDWRKKKQSMLQSSGSQKAFMARKQRILK